MRPGGWAGGPGPSDAGTDQRVPATPFPGPRPRFPTPGAGGARGRLTRMSRDGALRREGRPGVAADCGSGGRGAGDSRGAPDSRLLFLKVLGELSGAVLPPCVLRPRALRPVLARWREETFPSVKGKQTGREGTAGLRGARGSPGHGMWLWLNLLRGAESVAFPLPLAPDENKVY